MIEFLMYPIAPSSEPGTRLTKSRQKHHSKDSKSQMRCLSDQVNLHIVPQNLKISRVCAKQSRTWCKTWRLKIVYSVYTLLTVNLVFNVNVYFVAILCSSRPSFFDELELINGISHLTSVCSTTHGRPLFKLFLEVQNKKPYFGGRMSMWSPKYRPRVSKHAPMVWIPGKRGLLCLKIILR